MSRLRPAPLPPPDRLRGALRPALAQLGRPLRVLAEGLEGISGEIDLVAADPAGALVGVLVARARPPRERERAAARGREAARPRDRDIAS